ncbi:C69 family dipeptidase [Sporolactobacillus sp. THM19-2]|uniref:C69 family dipeptidase n=1 Tax=Sporolactobacillus sp. THM19-2 TaxID=2511171 RepID=UPI00102268EA|nr:C69 family dipeptidase [Sporolactobacillus sp. THM19-2]RYL86845.1 C69 family dipeptidase [Sporolactobacillus sp. THM19-2]
MSKLNQSSCTAVLVGKKASIDGSTMIARNEDGYGALNPKRFTVVKAEDHQSRFVSSVNEFAVDLPDNALRHTFTPSADESEGVCGESGINSANVAMSATETEFTNPHVLGLDPLVKEGIGEEAMESVVLPYIHSAREGVQRLGRIIEEYGTYESNGIAFSDADEVWYMETVGGHHWAAQRIPDDAYAIAPNQTGIQNIDFSKPEAFMWSTDLRTFAEKNHLNPDKTGFNFRKIFGTQTEADRHYNTPRTWYGQKYLNPEIEQEPMSDYLPFIQRTPHKISIEDIQYILSSHYQGTPYDAFGNGTEEQKHTFRPIGIDRNQEFHILQIRSDVPAEYAAIHWLTFGVNLYSAQVPFFANVNDTPENYKHTTGKVDLNSAYWLNKTIAVLAEPQYHRVINQVNEFKDEAQSYVCGRVKAIDREASGLSGSKLTDFLTKQNEITAAGVTKRTYALFDTLVKEASNHMLLTFEKGQNL